MILAHIGNYYGRHTVELTARSYPDGSPMVKGDIRGWKEVYAITITYNDFVAGMFLVDALRERGISVGSLILPFIPGARQDRINEEGDLLFTLKGVSRMINERDFKRVVVVDPHSSVSPAMIDRCVQYPMGELYSRLKGFGFDGIIAPDAGATKRAELASKVLGIPVIQASKTRDVATGKLTGFNCPYVASSARYVIVDDICDGGGTFVGLASSIQKNRTADQWEPKLSLFTTHGLFTQGTKKLTDVFETAITTDTVAGPREGIEEFPVVQELINYA